jgi:hypothetical protein
MNLRHSYFDIVSDFDIRISCLWRTFSTPVEKPRQIHSFLQNKPNFRPFRTKNNDPTKKQTQFKPNSKPNKPNLERSVSPEPVPKIRSRMGQFENKIQIRPQLHYNKPGFEL